MTNGSQLSQEQLLASPSYYRDKTGRYTCNGMQFPVRIIDARKVYGRVDALITPIGGDGQTWVEATKITLDE